MDTTYIRLYGATVSVNDETVFIKPDSAAYTDGKGEFTQEAASAGADTEVIFSEDLTTKIGKIKFEMPNTEKNAERVREWKNNLNSNVVKISRGTFSRTGLNMAMTNDPEIALSKDGAIIVEFSGLPLK